MQSILDLKNIQVFVAFCQHMNMSNAAKQLGITQSAVSQHIKSLEDNLGVQLIDREVRPMRLTTLGTVLKCRGKALLAEAERTSNLLKQHSAARYPLMRIGLLNSFSDMCLPEFFQATSKLIEQPIFRTGAPDVLGNGLLKRELDCIFVTEPFLEVDMLERHKIIEEPYFVVYSNKVSGIKSKPTLADIAAVLPFIFVPTNMTMERRIESYIRIMGISLTNKMEVSGFMSIMSMVEAGLGWSVMTPLILTLARRRNYLHDCRLLMLPREKLMRKLFLISHADELADYPSKLAKVAGDIIAKDWLCEVKQQIPQAQAAIKIYH